MRGESDGFGGWTRWSMKLGAVLVALALLVPATAAAQSEGEREVDEETAKKVLKLLKAGKKDYQAEDYQKAYDHFKEAHDLWPRPAIQARLGKAAEELGNDEKALEHYRAYLDAKPKGEMADEIRTNIEGLTGKMPATVALRSNPSGATVYLGSTEGEKLGSTPLETSVKPGEQTFVFEAEGHETTTRTWELKGGKERSFTVDLTKKGTSPQAFDEPATPSDTEAPSGGGGEGWSSGTWGWATAVAGLAGLGTGGVFTFVQSRTVEDANSLDRQSTSRDKFERLKSSANRQYRTSLIAYSIGGTLTAVGTGLLLNHYLSKGSTSGRAARLQLQLDVAAGADGGVAGFRLKF